ncbi:hypothetical protein [Nannocystis punicea]|uniref:Uncharacterized protein n=1 Tax=Nannocystis punicea TaxID=2995304 RepID=A0ABY7HFM5_9BACT|nr:hypothetical protein [Nannocystis poenicansa]WAS98092.1 hypothetical protein O0S08_18290 [Nannocystis poenicansa]
MSVTRETATTSARCSECGADVIVRHTVARRVDDIRWSASVHCLACGLRQESDDDVGDLEARAAVLAAHGEWTVALTSLGPRPIWVLRAIRDILGFWPAAARARLDRLAHGTRVEMEALLAKFVAEGARGACVRVDPGAR